MDNDERGSEEPRKPIHSRGYKSYLVVMTALVLIAAGVLMAMYLSVYSQL